MGRKLLTLFAMTAIVLTAALACVGSASAAYKLSGTFASGPGAGNGELTDPGRAAVEQATGNLFVVDSGNDRVQVFAPNGSGSAAYLTQFGSGELSAPWGIAIDENAGQTFLYVADAGNDRIVKYASDEAPVPTFSVDGTFTSPAKGAGAGQVGDFHAALAVDPTTHDLLVADTANARVDRFNSDGSADGSFDGSAGSGSAGAFAGPIDVAVNSSGDVYVIDATGDIKEAQGTSKALRYSPSGDYKATLPSVGTHERVATVAVNPATDEVAVSGDQDNVYEAGPTPYVPLIGLFDSANNPLPSPALAGSSEYDTVSGLAFVSGSPTQLYVALDKSYYLGDHSTYGTIQVQAFFEAFPPMVTISAPTTVTASGATIAGTVDPEGKATEWKVEYKRTTDASWSATAPQSAGAGTAPVDVESTLSGLAPGRLYLVRLQAESADGAANSSQQSFTTDVLAPQVLAQSSKPGFESAALTARLDAGGGGEYHFEYGASAAYGSSTPSQTLAAGKRVTQVFANLGSLTPATTYHYRVVVSNGAGTAQGLDQTFTTTAVADPCPNAALRTGASAHLADCRAYELVTPTNSDADIRVVGGPVTPDGDTVCFNSEDPLAGSDPNGIKTADDGFCAWRSASGWETKWVTGPAPVRRISSLGANVYLLSPDGQRVVFASDALLFGNGYEPPTGASHGPNVSAYMWEAGQTTWLAPAGTGVGDPPAFVKEFSSSVERRPLAASADLTRGVFMSLMRIVPEDQNNLIDMYEWYPGGVRLVSRDSSGNAAGGVPGLQGFYYDEASGLLDPGNGLQMRAPPGTMSADGGRIFFQHDGAPLAGDASEAPEGPDPEVPNAELQSVYMREGDELTLVSPRRGSGPNASVWFVGATADGDVAYLETNQQLTPEAKQSSRAIYRYDVESDGLELVADAPGGVKFLTLSSDGSTIVYRERQSRHLIVERDGVKTILGTLTEADIASEQGAGASRDDARMLRVTPDGRVVVFAAGGEFADLGPGQIQVFRWEADEGLERISAPPGDDPEKGASIGAYNAGIGGEREELFANHSSRGGSGRVISDDGSRVFFETPEALAGGDVNGATDVYEWHEGEINLVSAGTGGNSFYHGNSADGKTVFITTFDRLLPEWDHNAKRDLYAARSDGGFPPPVPPPSCRGEACQPGQTAPAPASPDRSANGGNLQRGLAAAKLAKGGRFIRVTVLEPGKVIATLRGRLGKGKAVTVARTSKTARKAGLLRLPVKLSGRAKKRLRKRGSLPLTLTVKHAQSQQTITRKVTLHG